METIIERELDINTTDTIVYPVKLAIINSTNDEVYHSLYVRADWLVHDLLVATIRTAAMCLLIIAGRKWKELQEQIAWKR